MVAGDTAVVGTDAVVVGTDAVVAGTDAVVAGTFTFTVVLISGVVVAPPLRNEKMMTRVTKKAIIE